MMQIYKVFVNNCSILFTDSITKAERSVLEQKNSLYKILCHDEDLITILEDCNYFIDTNLIYLCNNPLNSLNAFISNFNFIAAAGGLVQKNNKELLMIYKNNNWDLPKGKVDNNESAKNAAIREVQEETNLNSLHILSDYFSTYHIYRDVVNSSKIYLKETKWFLMETRSQSHIIIPQLDEGISEVKWVNFEQIKYLQTYNSIQCVLRYFRIN